MRAKIVVAFWAGMTTAVAALKHSGALVMTWPGVLVFTGVLGAFMALLHWFTREVR